MIKVSIGSAIHLHGIIKQIPQEITLTSTVHTKKIHTRQEHFLFTIYPPFIFSRVLIGIRERVTFL